MFLVGFNITYLSPELLASMQGANEVGLHFSAVPKVYISPDIEVFEAIVSDTREVIIDDSLQFKLRVLNISSNELTKIPANMNVLSELQIINFNDNKISTVDLSLFNGLEKLARILLGKNRISQFTLSHSKLPNLTHLVLEGNELDHMPLKLQSIPSLQELSLRKNKLQFVEMSQFNGLPNLKLLDLSDNRIQIGSISEVNLPSLETLKLKNCALLELDLFGWIVPKLKHLHVQDNRLDYLGNFPDSTVRPATKSHLELHGTGNRWSCTWLQKIHHWITFVGQQEYRPCHKYVAKVCCFESDYNQDLKTDRRIQAAKNQNRQLYGMMGAQLGELTRVEESVARFERRLEGLEQQIAVMSGLLRSVLDKLEHKS